MTARHHADPVREYERSAVRLASGIPASCIAYSLIPSTFLNRCLQNEQLQATTTAWAPPARGSASRAPPALSATVPKRTERALGAAQAKPQISGSRGCQAVVSLVALVSQGETLSPFPNWQHKSQAVSGGDEALPVQPGVRVRVPPGSPCAAACPQCRTRAAATGIPCLWPPAAAAAASAGPPCSRRDTPPCLLFLSLLFRRLPTEGQRDV